MIYLYYLNFYFWNFRYIIFFSKHRNKKQNYTKKEGHHLTQHKSRKQKQKQKQKSYLIKYNINGFFLFLK
jgi:hypothetical protein